jgi:hypothetical protein
VRDPVACLLYRSDEVSVRALSFGFALATAGYDLRAPHLLLAELPELRGWSVAFYRSGSKRRGPDAFTDDDEIEHARELFEEELPPGLLVQRATGELASELGAGGRATERASRVYALCRTDVPFHDDAWRFDGSGVTRRFLRDGDEGLEAGSETPEAAELLEVELPLSEGEGEREPSEAQERAALEKLAEVHGGSSFLARELAAPVLGPLIGALYRAGERVAVQLVQPDPASIECETRRLCEVLGREPRRGATSLPPAVAGVAPPDTQRAFAAAYDWADPTDAQDLYRELAIGAIEGTLHFTRPAELSARERDATWSSAAAAGLFPLATLRTGALGGGARVHAVLALSADGAALELVDAAGKIRPAGPTFAELLRYLSLGWSSRTAVQDLALGALMLRARVRAEQTA